ncbi:MAG: hemin uptake protein HemP [Pirellula sp.]|jgi:hemin uptake protein HemP
MSKEPEPNPPDETSIQNTPLRRLQGLGSIPKIISFAELCRCGDEIWIENEGAIYRLRRTRQGKLILTK